MPRRMANWLQTLKGASIQHCCSSNHSQVSVCATPCPSRLSLTVSSTWTLIRPIASDTPYGRQLTSSLGFSFITQISATCKITTYFVQHSSPVRYLLPRLTQHQFTLVYACKSGDGPTVMVKPSDLKNVKQSWCRAIEYRDAQERTLLRCAGNVFTDEVLVKVENGCKEVTNDPLK